MSFHRSILMAAPAFVLAAAVACSDSAPSGTEPGRGEPRAEALQTMLCEATVATGAVRCTPTAVNPGGGLRPVLIAGQNIYLQLASSNVAYDSGTEVFSFDVTVRNLMPEAMGTPDGTTPDVNGIRVAFHSGPTVTSGTGIATVLNADGVGTFTGTGQPYFQYNTILDNNEVSGARTWQLGIPATANSFSFSIVVSTEVQPLLVINEVLVNPGGTIADTNGEWVELYNRGARTVNLGGLLIADSAASGRRPYHVIASSVQIPSGGYAVLGNTTNTTNNGGVPMDYAYGAAMVLTNSLDAVKLATVYGTDTLTIDRTQFASAAISAQNGISRELTNPSLDNSNMDGSNWADALVTAVYGPGGRGTPRAQNSTFTTVP
jgi:hypothetical protein